MSTPPVFETQTAYYNNSTKRWMSGTFTLTQSYIQFQEEDDNQQNFRLHLCAISGFERRHSSFLYPSIVVSAGSEKHWFASFPNRDTVYNLIELFWRESLLSKPQRAPSEPKKSRSPLGKKLLGILYESESTLVNAANALVDQGRQLEESQNVLEDTNSDLDVAERFLKSMSLKNVLLMKQKSEPVVQTEETVEEEPRFKRYEVTFTSAKDSSGCCNWKKGFLIFKDNIVLLDEHKNEIFSIEIKDLDTLQISSPWEFCLTFSSGLSAKSCHIMCPQLSRLLKFLNSVSSIKRKIVFEDDGLLTESASCSNTIPNDQNPNYLFEAVRETTRDSPTGHQTQTQEESEEVLSDQDLKEISNVLSNLQALGSEVSQEQQEQMEKINSLIADVEKTELRIKADNKEIKKNT